MEFVLDLGVSKAAILQRAESPQSVQRAADSTQGSVTHNNLVIKLD